MSALARSMTSGDGEGVRAGVRREVLLTIDSGGLLPGPSTILDGRAAAASALLALVTPETSVTVASINGEPGVILTRDDAVIGVITAETRSGMLSSIWVVCNPEKLRHWNR